MCTVLLVDGTCGGTKALRHFVHGHLLKFSQVDMDDDLGEEDEEDDEEEEGEDKEFEGDDVSLSLACRYRSIARMCTPGCPGMIEIRMWHNTQTICNSPCAAAAGCCVSW